MFEMIRRLFCIEIKNIFQSKKIFRTFIEPKNPQVWFRRFLWFYNIEWKNPQKSPKIIRVKFAAIPRVTKRIL
jgi:hypothetical protein